MFTTAVKKTLAAGGVLCWLFAAVAGAATLPPGIKWETNDKAPPYASPNAKIGGVLKSYMLAYPLTFRLVGPNSNDGFASWNRVSCLNFALVERHPNTLEFIPELATHWAVMPDQKTLYFKLDPDVTFADGVKVTADHYVFGWQMMLSEYIRDPYYNKNTKETIARVEKIDDHTLKIVGAYPSWRALAEFQVSPMPMHAIKLDDGWVKRDTWKSPVCVGPYQLTKYKDGSFVTFERVKNWWGDNKRYLKGRFNFDQIHLKVIRDEKVAFEHFKKGDLSFYVVTMAQRWAKETDFDQIQKGWMVKRRIFTRSPEPTYGIAFNYRSAFFQNKKLRKALQHLFDFDKINHKLMYDAYVRINSFFGGTEYEKRGLLPYAFDPAKASSLLAEAGYKERGPDGILVNDKKERCSFTLTYGSAATERHLSIYAEDLKAAGVEMNLRLVDEAKAFKDGLDKNFQAIVFSRSSGLYPSPDQYLHSDYAKTDNNNNIFAFADPEVDKLIDVYMKNLDFKARLKAMHRIEDIVKDEAFYLPFWTGPYVRVLFWNAMGYTDEMEPLYSSDFNDSFTYWFDDEKGRTLEQAQKKDTVISGVNDHVDFDPHHVLKKP